jgi:hypothetical protein
MNRKFGIWECMALSTLGVLKLLFVSRRARLKMCRSATDRKHQYKAFFDGISSATLRMELTSIWDLHDDVEVLAGRLICKDIEQAGCRL